MSNWRELALAALLIALLCPVAFAPIAFAQTIYPYQTSAAPVQGCPETFDTRKTNPIVLPESFGAKGDGVTDDTAALQKALDSLTNGGTLRLAAGKTYMKQTQLYVRTPNTRIWGYGATLFLYVPPGFVASNNNYRQTVKVTGQGSGVLGVRFTSNIGGRTGGNSDNAAIHLAGDGVFAIDNLIQYTMMGITSRMASNYLVARNVIERTWADAIHNTSGTHNGRIVCNVVREVADDGVAVVNYSADNPGGPPTISEFEIAYNDVRNSQQGRGVTVTGGAHIQIHDNYIQGLCKNAGIIVHGDDYWSSASVENVQVYNNTIRDIQMDPPRYDPESKCQKTGQAGIHLGTPSKQWRLDNVSITGNVIDRVYKYGIYAYNVNGCNITQSDNTITGATIKPLVWQGFTCPDATTPTKAAVDWRQVLIATLIVLAILGLVAVAWYVTHKRKPAPAR